MAAKNSGHGERLDPAWLERVVVTGEPAAIATIFRTRGFTPRQAGARMLITDSGEVAGSVGGGSGEAAVLRAAAGVIAGGRPQVLSAELYLEMAGGKGADCYGAIEVLIEPLLE